MTRVAARGPRRRPPRGCGRSRCSGTGCPRSPRAPRGRSGSGSRSSRSCTAIDETGRAEAALHRALGDEGALHVGQRAARRRLQPLDGHDLGSTGGGREHEARAHELPSTNTEHEPHSPCSHPRLRAGQPEPLAQHVEQALAEPRVGTSCSAPLTVSAYVLAHDGGHSAQHAGLPWHSTACRRYAAVAGGRRSAPPLRPRASAELVDVRVARRDARRPSSAAAARASRTPRARRARPAPPIRARRRPCRRSRSTTNASDATAITIALRTPTLRYSCGPRRTAPRTASDQLAGARARCASARAGSRRSARPARPRRPPPRPSASERRRAPAACRPPATRWRGCRRSSRVADLRRADGARRVRQRRARASASGGCISSVHVTPAPRTQVSPLDAATRRSSATPARPRRPRAAGPRSPRP